MYVIGRRIVASLLGLALISSVASAATITGRVTDANTSSILPNVSVTIPELGRRTVSTNGGEYTLTNVPAGDHKVVVSYIGYDDISQVVTVASGDREIRADFVMGQEVLKLGKFTVSGNREGQAKALQEKRFADNVMDIVSADSAGKLPDGNAAEAVRRLPGVFAEIDQNEGRYVVVRGIDANLNNITINGISVGSTEGVARGAAMDAVPADLIKEIRVKKAVLPSDDAQAIGASVDIITASAFDHKEAFGTLTLAGGYYNGPKGNFAENKTTPYSGSAFYSNTFGGGKFGLVVGGSYSFRHYISNRRSGGGTWFPAGPVGTPGASIFFPADQSIFHYDVQRWRAGANVALEYKPSTDHYYALRLTENRFKDQEGREYNDFAFFQTAFPASFTATTATFTGGRSTVEYRYYHQRHNITNLSFEGRDTFGDGSLKLDYTVALGEANKIVPNRIDWEFRSGNVISSTLDIAPHYWVATPSANFYDATTFPLRRLRRRKDDETEDNVNAYANLKREFQINNHNAFWQVGARILTRKKDDNRENLDYNAGTGVNLLNLSQVAKPAQGVFGDYFKQSPQINFRVAEDLFKSSPNYFVTNAAGNLSDSNVTDFHLKEKVGAAYGMGKIEFGSLSVLAGLRVEKTEADVNQTELATIGGVTAPRNKPFSKDYTNVMPGIHFTYTITKNWIIRAAWTNTLGRPNYPDMAATSVASYVQDPAPATTYTISISEGNPDLKPYESSNFDLTSEYYFANNGIFSISGFYKDIDNPIFTQAYTLRNGTYQGFSYSSLSYSRPLNADSGKISGIEFNFQQQLTMLPSPFDGLGFSINYTVATSEEHIPGVRASEDLEFLKQAPRIYNVALFYEKYGIEARVAYTYTGAFRKVFGGIDANSDSFQDERKILDAKISYKINDRIRVFADVINLGQEPLDEYTRYQNWNGATESYWWTANFGVQLKL